MKRGIDVTASAIALTVLSPGLLLVALLVRLKLGTPILFTQPRLGMGGGTFTIYKFRSMTDARGADGALLPDEERMTPLGTFLRSTSIDELPELINVLKGDMSLVGPRPLVTWYLSRYSAEQARRMEVRPGVTGLAQVRGRNALPWDERFRLDVHYVDHWSVTGDLGIIVQTVWAVLRRTGISAEGHATMPSFMGEAGESAGSDGPGADGGRADRHPDPAPRARPERASGARADGRPPPAAGRAQRPLEQHAREQHPREQYPREERHGST